MCVFRISHYMYVQRPLAVKMVWDVTARNERKDEMSVQYVV